MKKASFLVAVALATPAFAQNDECTGAVTILANTPTAFDTTAATTNAADPVWGCAGSGGNDIWFSYTMTQASDLEISTCNNATYDTAIEIFSGTCGALVPISCNDDGPGCAGFSSLAVATGLNAGDTVLFRIGGFNGAQGTGTVEVTEFVAPPTPDCLTPDSFEDNDDCANAAAIGDGNYPMLNVEEADNDFFAVTVPAGATIDASILFLDAFADVDLYLWDPLVACDTNVAGTGTGSGALAVGFSASDDETISYTNATGAAQNLILEVDMFTAGGCNDYELVVSGTGPATPGPIGSNYCTASPNSTGAIGTMSGFGFTSVSANDVTITASNLPANQFGAFITSTAQAQLPLANGALCLGNPLDRFFGPGQVQSSGAMGEISLTIDLTAFPNGGGVTQVMAGETRNFQLWHRDNVGAGANFTDGLQIDFTN